MGRADLDCGVACPADAVLKALVSLRSRRREWSTAEIDGTPLLLSRDVGAAVVGFVRPFAVIPDWALLLEPASRSLFVMHGCEQFRSRDMVLGPVDELVRM